MDLDQQIQVLIEYAPKDGTTPKLVEAISPVLKAVARQLQHSQYYILQTLDHNWMLTTISNRSQPDLEKSVIYAYPTLKDVASGPHMAPRDPQVLALPVPVTHILFQMMAMESVDSIIFFETPGNSDAGTEINRADVQKMIHLHLQQIYSSPVPPDIA